ncbi:hypothetical protein GCM10028786_34340 [Flaviaesturariibacter terrae]
MTLNWSASSPATAVYGYGIYRSTDNSNFSLITTVPVGTNTYAASGLSNSTTYYWRVIALSEATTSTALSGSQSTSAVTTSAASGPWNQSSTWVGGVVPVCGTNVVIASGHNVTVSAADGVANAGTLTINSGGTITVTGSTLTVGCTNNNAFVNNSGTIDVQGGTLAVNGNIANASGSSFKQSGGAVNIDGNDNSGTTGNANSVASGSPLLGFGTSGTSYSSGTISLTAGTLTIVDPHAGSATNTSAYSIYGNLASGVNFFASPSHTTQFGNGSSTGAGASASGFYWDLFAGSGRLNLGSVVVNSNTGTNRLVTVGTASNAILGNLTVTSNAFDANTGTLIVGGNISVATGATLYAKGTINFATVSSGTTAVAQTTAQSVSVSGTGSIQNLASSATANFTSITITNTSSSGVTFGALNNVFAPTYASFSGASVSGTLIFNGYATTATGNALCWGTVSGQGTALTITSGGMLPGSTFARSWSGGQTGGTIAAGTVPAATTSQFPFIDAASASANVRHAWIERVTPAAAGITAVTYTGGSGTSSFSANDAGYLVNQIYNGFWTVSTFGTTPSAGSFKLAASAPGAFGIAPSSANARLVTSGTVLGANQTGTVLPHAQRITLSLADLTSGSFFMGINSSDVPYISVQSGDWNNASTWYKGTVPTSADVVNIAAGHTVTVTGNAAALSLNVASTGAISATAGTLSITGASASGISNSGTITVNGATVSLGVTNNTVNNRTFTNNGTLTIQSGNLNIYGNLNNASSSTFNQSGGEVTIDGNAAGVAANSVASGTHLLSFNPTALTSVNLTGGRITIVDPHASSSTSTYAVYLSGPVSGGVNVTSGHTFRFGNGASTDAGGISNGFYLNTWSNTTGLPLGNVVVDNNGGTNRLVASLYNLPVVGDLTINPNSEWAVTNSYVKGSVVNNGTLTSTGLLYIGASSFLDGSNLTLSAATNAQTIGGTGIFRNATTSPSANLAGLTTNNSNASGITLNVPLSVSGTLTMTSGLINTSSTNLLTLGTASAAGTLSATPSATNMIVGPFARTFATRSATGTYDATTMFPVGKGSVLTTIYLDPTTTGAVVLRAEGFTGNSGTTANGVSGLSGNRWEVATTSGFANLTSSRVRVSDAAITSASQSLVQASSAAGVYDAISGLTTSFASGTVTTNAGIAAATLTANAYLAFATLTPCVAPANGPSNLLNTASTATSLNGSFTAAVGGASGYLVVRYPNGSTPTAPADGSTYAAAATLGTGTVVSSGSSLSFTTSSLTANSIYTFYIYSYNNTACAGIAYNTAAPLSASFTTCPTAPAANAATNTTASGFTANWTAVTGAVSYQLDVSTSSSFSSFISGYNSSNVGNVTSVVVNNAGNTNVQLYYRVRAVNSACASASSNTISVCPVFTVPYSENFDVASSVPSCSSTQNAGSGNNWSVTSATGYTGNVLYYPYNSSNAANAWWYTPGLQLTAGTTYRLSFKYGNNNATYTEKMKVYYGTSATSASMTNLIKDYPTINSATVGSDAVTFTPSVSAVYYIGFNAYSAANQFYLYVDEISVQAPCATPTAPTALTFPTTGPGTINGSFTAAATAPSGYMVVRYPAGAAEVAPSNATSYTVGQSLGTGVITHVLTGTSFTATGLSPSTAYDFYIYPYNNTSCLNGPVFGAALMGSQSTSGCTTINSVVTVGASGADFARLSDAALLLNGCPVSQPTVVKLNADYNGAGDTYPVVFYANSGASATNTISIRPDDAVSSMLTLSGSSSSPLIDFSGAKYYSIDGRPGSTGTTSYLTISNTGDGAAVRLFNDAQNNTITYTTLKAANTSASNGVVRITSAAGATTSNGNNNNVISYNNIDGNGTSPNGVYASGSAAPADNKSITISNNNIYNYYSDVASIRNTGIQIGGGNSVTAGGSWTISGNSFYQTVARSYANAVTGVHAINQDGGDGPTLTITGNYIGGTQAAAGGSALTLSGAGAYAFSGMRLFPGSTGTSTISNNTVQNISITTANTTTTLNYGIGVHAGQATISNNTIGSASTAGSIAFSGGSAGGFSGLVALNGTSTTGQNLSIIGNTVAGIAVSGSNTSQLTGINVFSVTTMTGTNVISGNTIGTAAAPLTNSTNSAVNGIAKSNAGTFSISGNSIGYLMSTSTSSSAQVTGISVTAGANTIGAAGNGNTIRNLSSSATNTSTTGSASLIGISMSSGATGQSINANTIYNLTNSSNSGVTVTGISLTGSTTGVNNVSRNLVYSLGVTGTSTSSVLNGIQVNAGATTFDNNVIRLGLVNQTLANTINGVLETSGTNNWYYNSIYIGGSGAGTATSSTYAFYSTNTGSRVIQNNAFQNARSNATTGGKHYVLNVGGTTASPSGLTLNNNVYYTASGFLGRYNSTDVTSLTAWKTTTYASGNGPGLDLSSYSADPNFNNPTAAVPDLSPNAALPSALEGQATPVSGITTDFAGTTRNSSTPDIGAYEFAGISAVPLVTLNGHTPAGNQCAAVSHTVSAVVTAGGTPITAGMVTLTYAYNGGSATTISMTNGGGNNWTADIPAAAAPANASVSYYVRVNDGSFTVQRNGSSYSDEPNYGISVIASSSVGSLCPGNSATLTSSVLAPNVAAAAGTATTYNSSSSGYPTLFGYYNYQDWQQFLFTAAELQALGLRAGPITKLTFKLNDVASGTPSGWTIRMGATSNSVLTDFVTSGLSTVFNGSFTQQSGDNAFTLTPFVWNGTDNIIVDIRGTGNDGLYNALTYYTTTAFNSVAYAYTTTNNTSFWTSSPTATLSKSRPNVEFAGTGVSSNSGLTASWSDGSSTVGTAAQVSVTPSATTTYTAVYTHTASGCAVSATPITITVGGALSATASATASAICSGTTTTLNVTATGGGQPYTYSWKDASNNSIGTTASVSVSPGTTTTYTVSVTDACGTMTSSQVTVTATALPVVTVTPGGTQTVCATSLALGSSSNAASAGYQWLLNGSNIGGATTSSYTASASGTYSLRVTDGSTGCVATSASTTVTLAPFPGAITITPSASTLVCLGSAVSLSAASTVGNSTPGITLLSENFNGSGPYNFTVVDSSVNNTGTSWIRRPALYSYKTTLTNATLDNTPFMLANSDSAGSGSKTNTRLVSTSFSTVGYSAGVVNFTHFFRAASEVFTGVEYSTDNGTTWATVQQYTASTANASTTLPTAVNISAALPEAALGMPNVRIRFRYDATWDYFWAVDNISVIATPVAQYAWSSATGSGLSLAQQAATASNASISVTPATTGTFTYTVTASVAGSTCTSSNQVTITTVTPSVAPSTLNKSAAGTLCPGTNVILTQTGGTLGQGAYWQWYQDASFTQTVGGQLTSANAQLTVSPTATTSYYLRAEGGTAPCSPIVAAASPVAVTVYAASAGGTLSSAQSICSGGSAANLTLSGSTGTIVWQSATDAAFTQNLTTYGSSAATLTGAEIGALTQSLYVRAVVTSGGGCSSANSNSVLLTVNSYPAVYTVQGSATYCDGIGSIVSLSNSEAGASYQLLKDGVNQGAPVAGTGASLSFGAQPSGTYTVVASNASGCSRSMSGSAVLNAVGPFTASISADNNILCTTGSATMIRISGGPALGTVSVSTNGGAATTYTLDGSGAASFPTGALNVNTTYTITAVSNGTCATVVTTGTTVYVGALVADQLINPSVCAGSVVGPIAFTGNFPAGTTYNWTSSNPAVGLAQTSGTGTQLPSFTAVNATTGNVYTDIAVWPNLQQAGCEVHKIIFRIFVQPKPTVNAVGNQSLCAGTPTTAITFSGALSGTTYNWTNTTPAIGMVAQGAGTIPSFVALNNSAQSTLTANFTVTPYLGGCAGASSSFSITVNKASATIAYPNTPYCQAGPAAPQLTGTRGGVYAAPAGIVFYSTATGEINLAASTPGTYTVTYTITGAAGGCGGVATTSITILPAATITGGISNQAVCAGNATTLVQPTGNAIGYSWVNLNPSVGLPASGNGAIPSFTAVNNGSTVVTAQVNVMALGDGSSTCNSSPLAFRYTVYPRPVVDPVSVAPYCRGVLTTPVTFTSTTPGTSYTWTNSNTAIGLGSRGSGGIPAFTAANPLAGNASTATVTVTPMASKCAGTPYAFVLMVADCATQAGDHSGSDVTARIADQVVVGPNPATSRVTVSYRGTDEGPFTVQLITQYGQAITKPATFTGSSYTMDLTGLTPGVYVLQVINPRTQQTVQKQIVKL